MYYLNICHISFEQALRLVNTFNDVLHVLHMSTLDILPKLNIETIVLIKK